jgi:hypothetical protein
MKSHKACFVDLVFKNDVIFTLPLAYSLIHASIVVVTGEITYSTMPEHDALVLSYSHLAKLSRASDALQTLKKVASLVKPIMRARNWKVRELAEFYPEQQNLLGRCYIDPARFLLY